MNQWKKIWKLTAQMKTQSIRMQRKLFLYWISVSVTLLLALFLILSMTGVLFNQNQEFSDSLQMQLSNIERDISNRMDTLAAKGILLSENISQEMHRFLLAGEISVSGLNDDPENMEKLQKSVYEHLNTMLRASECSGAYMILDATINTQAEGAQNSRAGLYLRLANLNSRSVGRERISYFRGIADVAREKQLELHNRWNLEFDISLIPGFETLMGRNVKRLADAYYWMESMKLTDTWEKVMLLLVPILDENRRICGICGLEISSLYFHMTYSDVTTPFGDAAVLIAPIADNQIWIKQGLVSGVDSFTEEITEPLVWQKGDYYNTYAVGDERYVGKQQILSAKTVGDKQLAVVVLMPQERY